MENTCENIHEQILELITGTLSAEKAADLERHISKCPGCRAYLEALQTDDKLLGEFAEAMQPRVARLEEKVIGALNRAKSKKPVSFVPVWKTVVKSRITKFAAAAVIIIAVSLFIIHLSPDKHGDSVKVVEARKSPAELTTFASLTFAYRQGGMEMVEQMCDKALKMAGQRPANVSMQEFFEEINNGKSERTEL